MRMYMVGTRWQLMTETRWRTGVSTIRSLYLSFLNSHFVVFSCSKPGYHKEVYGSQQGFSFRPVSRMYMYVDWNSYSNFDSTPVAASSL
uniref:Uncharacterized protein n=1 Tax=Utricularia reniformis TaxID=192314 RepID=A0A1Y0AZ96_9LAMI|nr:hypothetical protein AEK19_MT0181 [Utricularia reniformis]ART30463.1 hypothetical protein AEK19_MT0181 [Utricularia reniformis]